MQRTMSTLYLTLPGATLREQDGTLVVTAPKTRETIVEAVPSLLEAVVVVGAAHITHAALAALFAARVPVVWVTRGGDILARAESAPTFAADLRIAQCRAFLDNASRHVLATSFVRAKLHSLEAELEASRAEYACTATHSRLQALDQADTLDQLRGHEGDAAREYFEHWGAAFSAELTFPGRRRRPPTDPVNAMLSFGYTLLCNRLASLLAARGLDPAIGFLHEAQDARPSLALDLMEPFRAPVVDHCVRKLANLRVLRAEHFESVGAAVHFTREGLRIFLSEWENFLDANPRGMDANWRGQFQRQVDSLAMHFREGRPFEPFRAR